MTATLAKPAVGGLGCKHCVFWQKLTLDHPDMPLSGQWGKCSSLKVPQYFKWKRQIQDWTTDDTMKVKEKLGFVYTTASYGCPYRKTKET